MACCSYDIVIVFMGGFALSTRVTTERDTSPSLVRTLHTTGEVTWHGSWDLGSSRIMLLVDCYNMDPIKGDIPFDKRTQLNNIHTPISTYYCFGHHLPYNGPRVSDTLWSYNMKEDMHGHRHATNMLLCIPHDYSHLWSKSLLEMCPRGNHRDNYISS